GKGHKQALVSLTERKSRLSLIYKVERKTKDEVTDAVTKLLNPIKDNVLTLTSDNGKEFSGHETIADHLSADFYFAHAYSAWERGTNENTNGLIRQYFPKNRDFRTITDDEIIRVIKKLNNRPRKCLGFKTPNQVFFGELSNVACLPTGRHLLLESSGNSISVFCSEAFFPNPGGIPVNCSSSTSAMMAKSSGGLFARNSVKASTAKES
ncbi:MAG: IS30 family transposase, partial [Nitrosopumilus sp.]